MFGLFKKKTEKQVLEEKYRKLLEKSHRLSTVNRRQADEALAQAEEVAKEMAKLP